MGTRYEYVKSLADSSQERAKNLHLEYQELDDKADDAEQAGKVDDARYFHKLAAGKLNDYFYWIGHANAYRGIALQVDFMETQEEDMDAEPSCP